MTAFWITALGYYGIAIVSAVVPWVNAEVVMLSAIPAASSSAALAGLVVAVAAGQMTGKSAMYWLSRRSSQQLPRRWQQAVERWQARFSDRPRSMLAMTFVSALVGLPPFFVISLAAGALRVAFVRFLAVGTAGRLIHFALVACVPELLRRTL